MEHSRKQKLLVVLALVVAIASLSIGFAAFSTTLNISPSASVTPNSDSFSVKFSTKYNSLVVGPVEPSDLVDGVTATNGIINNSSNPTVSNLSVTFTEPGQFVQYSFFVRNEGEYTAYLNNINFIGDKVCVAAPGTSDELVQAACEGIEIRVLVEDLILTESASVNGYALVPGSSNYVGVIIEYLGSGAVVDGPFKIDFPSISLTYSTVDDSSIKPDVVRVESGDLNTVGSVVAIGNEKFYVIGQENGNVKLLSMYNLHVGNSADEVLNVTPLASPTGIQDGTAKGYIDGEFPLIGTTVFSTTDSTYSGSIVEAYVDNYASYLTGLGANVNKVRLITVEELKVLGCNMVDYTCNREFSFVYSTTYWTGTSYDYDQIYAVSSTNLLGAPYYYLSNQLGVRPVIEIALSEFE